MIDPYTQRNQLSSYLLSMLVIACGSDDSQSDGNGAGASAGLAAGGASGAAAGGTSGAGTPGSDGGATDDGVLAGECPAGFNPVEGQNDGFTSDGIDRRFHVLLPDDLSTPRPVFVALTALSKTS